MLIINIYKFKLKVLYKQVLLNLKNNLIMKLVKYQILKKDFLKKTLRKIDYKIVKAYYKKLMYEDRMKEINNDTKIIHNIFIHIISL